MNYSKLIGFYICTNQFHTERIKTVVEAKKAVLGLLKAYPKDTLKQIRRKGNTFTAYHVNDKIEAKSLHSFLNF